MRQAVSRWLVVATVWAVSMSLAYNLCDLLFRCGCTWAWSGAAEHCNVHSAAGPRCPWCTHRAGAFLAAVVPMLGVEAAVILAPGRYGMWARIAAAAVAFTVVGVLAALGFALVNCYPHFLLW